MSNQIEQQASTVITAKEGSKTAKILQKFAELGNVGETAKALGIKYQHVYNTLRMKGIQPPSNRSEGSSLKSKMLILKEQGKTTGEIAKSLSLSEGRSISYQHVYNTLKGDINRVEGSGEMVEIEIDQEFMQTSEANEIEPEL